MYGNFASKPDKTDSQEKKLDHISKMRKIYLPSRKIGKREMLSGIYRGWIHGLGNGGNSKKEGTLPPKSVLHKIVW